MQLDYHPMPHSAKALRIEAHAVIYCMWVKECRQKHPLFDEGVFLILTKFHHINSGIKSENNEEACVAALSVNTYHGDYFRMCLSKKRRTHGPWLSSV